MLVFAGSIFFASLALILALFAGKVREIETGKVIAPKFKLAADHEALRVKELLFAAKIDLSKALPLAVYWGHVALHFAALEFARAARAASRKAHQLADFVSHKRNFQPRRTQSEFLRKVASGKREIQNGQSEDNRVQF